MPPNYVEVIFYGGSESWVVGCGSWVEGHWSWVVGVILVSSMDLFPECTKQWKLDGNKPKRKSWCLDVGRKGYK